MKTYKYFRLFFALTLMLACVVSTSFAENRANEAFSSIEVAFSSSFTADFIALTTRSYPTITVSVTLQRKEGSNWVNERTLPAPSFSGANTNTWGASKNYSAYGTSGETYRIKATFNAAGITATAYSVARTK